MAPADCSKSAPFRRATVHAVHWALLFLLVVPCLSQDHSTISATKVRIEAPELDKSLLLDKLNQNGLDRDWLGRLRPRLKFQKADEGFDYRIEFNVFQHQNTGAAVATGVLNFSGAEAKVYDNQGNLLFEFTRETRFTDTGAANAVAEEIVKRLLLWQKEQAKEAVKVGKH
jgi:hypothetical protein